jgi:hypothetical protein
MDDRRFDDLTRRLASGNSRRQVLKTMAGGALGGLAGALGLGRAGAAGCNTDAECARGETCDSATGRCLRRGGGNGRPANQNQTQSQSVGIAAACTSDVECAPNETCVDFVCIPRGGGGQCVRGSTCTSDATCCGGEVCDTLNQVCVSAGGPCTNDTGTCFDSLDCCGNEECVGGLCQQTAGGCAPGAVCAVDAECCGGQVCVNSTCAQAARTAGCPEGQVRCNGVCVDISSDPNNCGACGVVCESGACFNGTCQELCGFGDEAVVCGPCEYCAGLKHPICAPCGPENCHTCIAGICQKLCTDCESCSGSDLDEDGNPTCQPNCPDPCTVCVFTEGETPAENSITCNPVVACGRCEDLVQNENGICVCVPRCTDPCTTCCCDLIEGNGDCTPCDNIGLVCNETGTCVEPAA